MSKRTQVEKQGFMDWLNDVVEASPEAKRASREEAVQLHLARALRKAREAAGMTQKLVAEESGLRQSVVSRLERPGHNANVATVLKYIHAVGADLVISVVVGGQAFSATETAERAVVVPIDVADWAETHGVSLREHVLNCVVRHETVTDMAALVRIEIHKEMRLWVSKQSEYQPEQQGVGVVCPKVTDGVGEYSVAA